MDGWIKIHRKMLDWEWFTDTNTAHLFLYLLLKANVEDGRFQGWSVPRGSLITSYDHLSKATGMSFQSVRTALSHLVSTGEVTSKVTNKFTYITICNYESYQDKKNTSNKQTNKQTNKQLTNKQQSTNKQLTTSKEYKNKEEKERKNIPPIIPQGGEKNENEKYEIQTMLASECPLPPEQWDEFMKVSGIKIINDIV